MGGAGEGRGVGAQEVDLDAVSAEVAAGRRCWLMKSEPEVYSLDDLARDGQTGWEGVRNYQARNFMRDDMAVGDLVLFYHSNAQPPGVAGLARVCRAAYPDPAAFDPASPYFDPKSKPEAPAWLRVDVAYVGHLARFVPLERLKADPELVGMLVIQRGQRLSVQPVSGPHLLRVLALSAG